jgi:quinol-cytochrome oxidoreductase complex cytochrome b subunit
VKPGKERSKKEKHPDNYIEANPLVTPPHIVPE